MTFKTEDDGYFLIKVYIQGTLQWYGRILPDTGTMSYNFENIWVGRSDFSTAHQDYNGNLFATSTSSIYDVKVLRKALTEIEIDKMYTNIDIITESKIFYKLNGAVTVNKILDSFGDIGGTWIANNTERFPVEFYAYDVQTDSYIVGIVHYTADGRLKMCRITSDGKNLGGAKYYIGGADINNPNPVPTSQKDIISKYNEGTVADNGSGYNFNIGRGFVVLGYKLSTENIGVVDGDYVNPPGLTYWAFCDDSNIICLLYTSPSPRD